MDIEGRLAVSYYEEIAELNREHGVTLVKHRETLKIAVKKVLSVYNEAVFRYLSAHPVPGTPRILALCREDERLIVIEEYISGDNLDQLLLQNGHFSDEETTDIGLRLCRILARLHACTPPVIHRDIKPSNVIRTSSGEVVLIDFNAARQCGDIRDRDTVLLGTVGYAAPEQYGFGSSDVRTDLYALGALLKDLRGTDERSPLQTVIDKCMQMNPADRFANAEQAAQALSETIAPEDERRGASPAPATGSGRQIIPVIAAVAVLSAIVAVAAVLSVLSHSSQKRTAEEASPTAVSSTIAASKEADSPSDGGNFLSNDPSDDLLPLELVDSGFSLDRADGINYVYYAVQIHNPNDGYDVEFPSIDVTIRTEDGRILKSDNQKLFSIAAGDTIWYGKYVPYEGEISNLVSISVNADPDNYARTGTGITPSVPSDQFVISGKNVVHSLLYDGDIYTGEVTNNSGVDFDAVCVCVIFKSDQKPVGGISTFVDNLPVGTSKAFETFPDDFNAFDSWEVHAIAW